MAIMTSCCCCLSTRTGSIGVGVICLVVSFCASVGLCFALINADEVTEQLTNSLDLYRTAVKQNMTIEKFKLVESVIGLDVFIENLRTILIVALVYYALYTFASLFMTYGSCTSLRALLLPWLVLEMVPFALQLTTIILLFVYGKDDPTCQERVSMGGWKLEVGKMALYMSFPVVMFYIFNQPQYFEAWTVKMRQELYPPLEQMHGKEIDEYIRKLHAKKEKELLKALAEEDEKMEAMGK
ncbi:hypothetical protein Pmani_020692 [Petrolisthes manimaculis]|uniref:Uncharacterized protein n=1 Tax=Petrolisthes manimaculis TaxID=1843537 RepID=A0AAE1PG82_9EUCA|nr:hypothetical protein Pmani_020692 [Petrolisthes manimaculis]